VAARGSLFNTQLIDFLTRRLTELEVPPEFQDFVITSVITGQIPSGTENAADLEALYGPIVAKVIGAAYDAVHSGVSISLIVAGGVILVSAVVAWATFSPRRMKPE